MQKYVFLSLLFLLACPTSDKEEGETEGDCLDGEDNDNDGLTDCYDNGCDGKPACVNSSDTGNWSSTDSDYAEDNWYSGALGCILGDEACVEHYEAAGWCEGVGGFEVAACPGNPTSSCTGLYSAEFTVGGAIVYYYNGFDGFLHCDLSGGTYSTFGNDNDEDHDTG